MHGDPYDLFIIYVKDDKLFDTINDYPHYWASQKYITAMGGGGTCGIHLYTPPKDDKNWHLFNMWNTTRIKIVINQR